MLFLFIKRKEELIKMRLRNYRNSMLLMIVLIGAMMLLAGCTTDQSANANPGSESGKTQSADTDKSLTLLFSFTTSSLDPHDSGGWTTIRAGLTETLVRLDDKLQLQPWLASSWEQKDEKTWVLTIRDGVTFHDGTPLDANAAKHSLERSISVNKGIAASLKIQSMEADGQMLTIHTSEPNPILTSELVDSRTAIVNVEAEKKMGTDAFNLAPIATGPFKLHKFTPDVELHVVRFEDYWAGPAKLSEAFFKMNTDANVRSLSFQSKEADIAYHLPAENIETIRKVDGLLVESVPSLRANFLYFNLQKPVLSDVRVRQAIDYLIDREGLVNHVMLGHAQPANGPFNPKLPFGKKESDIKQPNVNEAKRLLAEAGWQPGENGILVKDGSKLTLELITYKNRPELPIIAQILQGELAKVGVQVNIKSVEKIDAYMRSDSNWDLATYSNMTAPRGDAGYFFNVANLPGGSLNHNNFDNDPFNQLLTQLNHTSERSKRDGLTRKLVRILDEELPETFLFYPQVIIGVSERVVGFNPGAEEMYLLTHTLDVK
jgi:peptide/nickel transport system substrate-binding protein